VLWIVNHLLDNPSVKQLDPIVLGQDAELAQTVVLLRSELPEARGWLADSRLGWLGYSALQSHATDYSMLVLLLVTPVLDRHKLAHGKPRAHPPARGRCVSPGWCGENPERQFYGIPPGTISVYKLKFETEETGPWKGDLATVTVVRAAGSPSREAVIIFEGVPEAFIWDRVGFVQLGKDGHLDQRMKDRHVGGMVWWSVAGKPRT